MTFNQRIIYMATAGSIVCVFNMFFGYRIDILLKACLIVFLLCSVIEAMQKQL